MTPERREELLEQLEAIKHLATTEFEEEHTDLVLELLDKYDIVKLIKTTINSRHGTHIVRTSFNFALADDPRENSLLIFFSDITCKVNSTVTIKSYNAASVSRSVDPEVEKEYIMSATMSDLKYDIVVNQISVIDYRRKRDGRINTADALEDAVEEVIEDIVEKAVEEARE